MTQVKGLQMDWTNGSIYFLEEIKKAILVNIKSIFSLN